MIRTGFEGKFKGEVWAVADPNMPMALTNKVKQEIANLMNDVLSIFIC
jgi:hypothetical protein